MEWVASTLHTTSEHGVSSTTVITEFSKRNESYGNFFIIFLSIKFVPYREHNLLTLAASLSVLQ